MWRRLWADHSLSVVLGVGWLVSNAVFFLLPPGHWYDFTNMLAGCFGGGFVVVVLANHWYDKGADPCKPPE